MFGFPPPLAAGAATAPSSKQPKEQAKELRRGILKDQPG
jgi:hypothetical protein